MNLKGAGIVPLLAIFLLFSSVSGLKLEVEIITPITKARTLPSASSDPRGFVRKGQTFIVDGQSGEWYRISIYNSFVWIPKDATRILRAEEDAPAPAPAATAEAAPPVAPQPRTTSPALPAPGGASGTTAPVPAVRPGQTITIAQKSTAAETTASSAAVAPAPAAPAAASPAAAPVDRRETARAAAPYRPVAAAVPPPLPKPPPSRTWFSKRSLSTQVPLDAEGKEVMYFQVSIKTAPVYSSRSNASEVMANARKGEFFPLVEHTGLWCRIAMNDTSGWVELSGGAIVSAPKAGIDELMLIIIIAGGVLALVLVLIVIMLVRGRSRKKPGGEPKFHGLILARSVPEVKGAISGKSVPLDRHLSSIGFAVKTAHKLNAAQKLIDRQHFDLVFIDWYISDDIPGTVEILFTAIEQKNLPLAVFFNVSRTSEIPLVPVLLQAHHLGVSFTDLDISNLLTPTILSNAGQKAAASSALEGDIAEGNLPEIMEFIEIGKKTGALAIEDGSPIGVLYFQDGRVVHAAAANGVYGRDAINTLLNLKQGKFRFLLDKQPKVKDLNLSTLEVLMEWTKDKDEAHRN